MNKILLNSTFCLFLILLSAVESQAQKATITTSQQELLTYGFGDPNPIPILGENDKIYPYFRFDGYEHKASKQIFEVITLENPYIKVFVIPALGGKVWGAIEKSTGEEFIYRNEVVKYRNISMRGPWTSGGIEFNFGIIGHHPSTATPVDYVTQENADGSVSVTVGNIDLPSRTQWRVKISLPKDLAAFHTDANWYNPTPVRQAYYNWMTAAAPATEDLEFSTPGNQYLEHSGNVKAWPQDALGRDLSKYNQNDFGPAKSYHVVGEYNDFFGGYYRDKGYGFGHWSKYEEMPGQKLWLWAQSRAGAIWEDLLTDTDGQYIEFQAGRLFVQYFPGEINPISQANFEPYSADSWKEVWFPLKGIGGMVEASGLGAMNLTQTNDTLKVGINPFKATTAVLKVISNGEEVYSENMEVKPMQVIKKTIIKNFDSYEVHIDALDLHYVSEKSSKELLRSFETDQEFKNLDTPGKTYLEAIEHVKFREYDLAMNKLQKVIENEPYHLDARADLGELLFRMGEYEKGIEMVRKALSIDTYHPQSNYVAGILYRAQKDYLNARESLGWAARSLEYRSNAYTQLSEIAIIERDYSSAEEYALKALKYDSESIPAHEVLAISYRKMGENKKAREIIAALHLLDPLHHLSYFESYLMDKSSATKKKVMNSHRSELAYQTFLELAINYYNKGLVPEALEVLEMGPQTVLSQIWQAYLTDDDKALEKIARESIEFVFPYRRESLEVLDWASLGNRSWKYNYYNALNLWANSRQQRAHLEFLMVGTAPDDALFYQARSRFVKSHSDISLKDLRRAYGISPSNWRVANSLAEVLLADGEPEEALSILEKIYSSNKSNYMLGMNVVKAMNELERYLEAISVLDELHILPYEHATEGRKLYTAAYLGAAFDAIEDKKFDKAIPLLLKAKEWPEQLGVGRPYTPDERIEDYTLAYCYQQLGEMEKRKQVLGNLLQTTLELVSVKSATHVLALKSLQEQGKPEEVKRMGTLLEESAHGDSEVTQWVLNYFFNDGGSPPRWDANLRKALALANR